MPQSDVPLAREQVVNQGKETLPETMTSRGLDSIGSMVQSVISSQCLAGALAIAAGGPITNGFVACIGGLCRASFPMYRR